MLCEEDSASSCAGAQKGLVNSSSCCLSCRLEPALKNSSYKGPNKRSNSCCDGTSTSASAEEETSCLFTTISNPLFDNDKINFDEINSHVESNSNESTSNHDIVKCDYLDEFYRPLIPIHILEEERIRREHESDPHQEEINVVAITNDVLPPRVDNDDSDEEVDAVDVLRIDNFIQNSKHEYSESGDSEFDNRQVPLPPPEPPDKEFDFEIEISVVRNVIVKFECIDA
nr:hypothetical protein [Tanacetum cinerariifolium]